MSQELIEIIRYPIKSGNGQKLQQTTLTSKGLDFDRMFALVNPQGQVVTARSQPKMNLIDLASADSSLAVQYEGEHLRFGLLKGLKRSITHYSSAFSAQTISPEFDRWISNTLDEPLQLVQNDPESKRRMHKYNRPEQEVRMVDAAPILLINQASVDQLNRGISPPVHRDVFRGNLVIRAEAEQEFNHDAVQIGDLTFDIVAQCTRCKMTTITEDSLSFRSDGEPLKTLSQKNSGKAVFGVYLVPRTAGSLKIGESVKFL